MSILIDANLLVYATAEDAPEHERSRAWLSSRFADHDTFVGLAWPTLYALTRLLSNPRVMRTAAIPPAAAWEVADAYRRQRTTRLIEPGPAHHRIARELVATPGLAANDVPDVQLAALAIEHGLVLCSHDHGFARFAGLRWQDPLGDP